MSSSEKIAVAAHLHVLLRRKTGRVTDTEWLASNVEYAAEIARFARQKAAENGHADLAAWADKLEDIMAIPEARQRIPLVRQIATAASARMTPPVSTEPFADGQDARVVDTERENFPESGFIESAIGFIFGEETTNGHKKAQDLSARRYIRGLR